MSDRRFLASNGRVALAGLEADVTAERYVQGETMSLAECAFLRPKSDGARDRQLLFGDTFLVLEAVGDHVFGVSSKDGYVGYLPRAALNSYREATHWVSALLTHAWPSPSIKSEPILFLPMTAQVHVLGRDGDWLEIEIAGGSGFVPKSHLNPIEDWAESVVVAARAFLGSPYVWAGNEPSGIDCSGLVQVAFHAGGFLCPPDSDVQEGMPGQQLGPDEVLAAGDLVFWKGHVAIATGLGTIVHANAHHMAVVEELVSEAVARILATKTGPVTSRLRPDWTLLRR